MPGSLKTSNEATLIIKKYTIGRSHNNLSEIEDRETGETENLDYFGFYHPDGLTERDKDAEYQYRKKDAKRVDKWLNFMKPDNWSEVATRSNEKYTRRIFKGIPPPIRTRIWPILLQVDAARRDNVYKDMLKYAFASSPDIQQIDLDINRTFRSTTFYRDACGPRQQVLFRILVAYSMYNTEVGYCQGMSDIAGMLLIYIVDEEEAFWALAQLLNGPKHQMHCLFVRDFPGLQRYFSHHEKVIRIVLKPVFKHFQKQDVDPCTYAFKWYMQCFLGRLPVSLTLRIWDIFLLEGEKVLVAMAYNILKMHKRRLLKMDQTQIICFLQDEIVKDFLFDDDIVIHSLKDCLEDLRKAKLDLPPPLTVEMLPTREMGLAPPIWESRHDDTHEKPTPFAKPVAHPPVDLLRSDAPDSDIRRTKSFARKHGSPNAVDVRRRGNHPGSSSLSSQNSIPPIPSPSSHSSSLRHPDTKNDVVRRSPPIESPRISLQLSPETKHLHKKPFTGSSTSVGRFGRRKGKSTMDLTTVLSTDSGEDVWFVPSKVVGEWVATTGRRQTSHPPMAVNLRSSTSKLPLKAKSEAVTSDSINVTKIEGGPWSSKQQLHSSSSSASPSKNGHPPDPSSNASIGTFPSHKHKSNKKPNKSRPVVYSGSPKSLSSRHSASYKVRWCALDGVSTTTPLRFSDLQPTDLKPPSSRGQLPPRTPALYAPISITTTSPWQPICPTSNNTTETKCSNGAVLIAERTLF